jgi:hypothetical protein
MKNHIFAFAVILATACTSSTKTESETPEVHSQHQVTENSESKPKSPKTSAMAVIDGNHIHIDYSSPSVRGRQIFGGLVAFGEVWSAGAHKATSIQFDKAVRIGGKEISAGKYGFFAIPGENEWTLILNEVWDMHLADDYDPTKDVIRLQVEPKKLADSVESLTYRVEQISTGIAAISLAWASTQVSFEVQNQ